MQPPDEALPTEKRISPTFEWDFNGRRHIALSNCNYPELSREFIVLPILIGY